MANCGDNKVKELLLQVEDRVNRRLSGTINDGRVEFPQMLTLLYSHISRSESGVPTYWGSSTHMHGNMLALLSVALMLIGFK